MSSPIPPPEPQPGDILLFVHGHRLFDDFIKLMTLSKYYHAAIYASQGNVWEARPRGVELNSLQGRRGTFVVIPAAGGKGREALAWAETQKGAGYDRIDNLVILLEHVFVRLHLNIVPKGKYSCAEFVATAFYHAGERLFPDRDLNDIEPKDFARLRPPDAQPRRLR